MAIDVRGAVSSRRPNLRHIINPYRARSRPEARIGIHSPLRGEPYLVQPHGWGNIWVYGMDILLTGYLTYEEFRRKAHVLPVGSRVFQFDQTRVKNLAVLMAELNPLGPLFEKVRAWEAEKGRVLI